jgi:hypothetical protein
MSKEEAKQLLKALEKDEERVLFVPGEKQKKGRPLRQSNTTKGKDW